MVKIGYTHGRLHNGHFHTFLKILEKFDDLWVGIANPLRNQLLNMKKLDKNLQKTIRKARDPKNNPYSFIERYEMLRNSLIEHGIEIDRVRILPHFGYYETGNWKDFITKNATIVLAA